MIDNFNYGHKKGYDYNYDFGCNYCLPNSPEPIRYVPIDNSKKSDKDKNKEKDKDKEKKKFGCCCDTDSLRKLLLFFRRNNTPLAILSETFPILSEDPDNFEVFVNSVVGNLVYISRESNNGPVVALMPLCEIDHVIVATPNPVPGLAELINKIICKPTLEKDDCCCIKGIGDTIKCLANINLLFPFTDAILLETNTDFLFFILIALFALQDQTRAFANDDLYILNIENDAISFYFITPICNINNLTILDNLSDNGAMNSNNILSLFNENIREKLKNLNVNELLKEIRSSSFLEVFKKFNSVLS